MSFDSDVAAGDVAGFVAEAEAAEEVEVVGVEVVAGDGFSAGIEAAVVAEAGIVAEAEVGPGIAAEVEVGVGIAVETEVEAGVGVAAES